MNRQNHLFKVSGHALNRAANLRYQYHDQRLDFWKTASNQAIDNLREAGFEVREHDVTGGKRVEAVVDPVLKARVDECATKIAEHRKAALRYHIEAAAYATQADRIYELDFDDLVYFNLVGFGDE